MDKEIKYIQFPVSLLPEIFNDKQAFFDRVLSIGSHLYAIKLKSDPVNVARQLIYHYIIGKKSLLPKELRSILSNLSGIGLPDGRIFEICEDRPCYFDSKGAFYLMSDEDVILSIILNDYPEIREEAQTWYSHIIACKYFNIDTIHYDRIRKTCKTIPIEGMRCMVNLSIVWDYRKHNKTDYQLIQFAAYAAIKSILGVKDSSQTNYSMITARMLGYASIETMPETQLKHPFFEKYTKRYHAEKLRKALERDWNLKVASAPGMYGFMVSFTIDHFKLAVIAQARMIKNKDNELKEIKSKAREKAKQMYNKRPSPE